MDHRPKSCPCPHRCLPARRSSSLRRPQFCRPPLPTRPTLTPQTRPRHQILIRRTTPTPMKDPSTGAPRTTVTVRLRRRPMTMMMMTMMMKPTASIPRYPRRRLSPRRPPDQRSSPCPRVRQRRPVPQCQPVPQRRPESRSPLGRALHPYPPAPVVKF